MSLLKHEISAIGEDLGKLALDTVDMAKKAGADEVKCVGTAGVSSKLVVENGDFSLANTLTSKKLGLLVHKDKKKGSASTNSLSSEDRKSAVESALSLASFSLPDEYLTIADKSQAKEAKPLSFMVDHKNESLDLAKIGEIMSRVLETFKKEPRFALDRFEVSSHTSFHTLVNSKGVNQKEYQTSLHWDYLGMAKDKDEVSGMDYEGGFSFSFEDPTEKIKEDVETFMRQVISQLSPMKCPAYKGAVLISPRAANDLLLGTLLFHTSGRSVMDGKSRFEKSLLKEVCSPLISISDNPHDEELVGATSYDSDGLVTRKQSIIEKGVLKTHLHDCYSAHKTGATSTATSGGPFGLTIGAGDKDKKDLLNGRSELLYITRFSGNVDPLTGDFSGLAKASRLYKNGEDSGAVGETMVAGNVFEMAHAILGVSKEREIVSGSYRCPDFLVDGITVS